MGKVESIQQLVADYGNAIAAMCTHPDGRYADGATDKAIEARRLFKAIGAALTACVAEWRLISEAPRDGTKVFLAWPVYSGHACAGWEVCVGWFEERTSNTHLTPWRRDLFGLRETTYGVKPTHYQPLPPPPTTETETEGETK